MRRLLPVFVAVAVSSLVSPNARGDAPPRAPAASATAVPLDYGVFLARVGRANPELAAQRAGVSVAEAQIAVARVFQEPVLTAGVASVDVSGKGSPLSTTVGLAYTVELGGKRSARVAAAEAGTAEARAALDEFARSLRAAATNAYVDAVLARLVLERKLRSLAALEKLVAVNEDRARTGEIGEVAVLQSRVEAQRFKSDVIAAETDLAAATAALAVFLGDPSARPAVVGDLRVPERSFDLGDLVARAKQNRPELVTRRRGVESAGARVNLARANRWVDVTLAVGWQHTFGNLPANPSKAGPLAEPTFDALTATASVPIPLSRLAYRGELDAAHAGSSQATAQLRATEVKVDVEVRQALARYLGAVSRLHVFTDGGTLAAAERVADSTFYNYRRGGASLLEVLQSERTANEVYLAWYEALAEHVRALVAVEQAAGFWDVRL